MKRQSVEDTAEALERTVRAMGPCRAKEAIQTTATNLGASLMQVEVAFAMLLNLGRVHFDGQGFVFAQPKEEP